ncbi:conserved hypothetical protein [Tenacibaculum sp. 190524A05c]
MTNQTSMKSIIQLVVFSLAIATFFSCKPEQKETPKEENKTEEIKTEKLSEGEVIINSAIQAHGGELYDKASYTFVFRNRQYSFTNKGNSYRYSVIKQNDKKEEVIDVLDNGNFSRTINGKKLDLNEEDASRYGESLNSVIYFATLPYKLKDKAVNKTYVGEVTIKNENYNVVEVTFKQEGGGKDFEDQYYYWVNKKSNTVDYLAYNYKVNGGGVRFRSSYNRRNVGGIIFQDYINYKAEVRTPLSELPSLYENDKLKEVSRIDTENVEILKY